MACACVDAPTIGLRQGTASSSRHGKAIVCKQSHIASEVESFVYPNLEQGMIRLLRILPAAPRDASVVCCEIAQFHLDEELEYKALSYTWGGEQEPCTIYLNGRPWRVRRNLWRFLNQARSLQAHCSGWIWIDAICVDQSNDPERTHQVNFMFEIYRRAQHVLVWLGPQYGDSDKAMQELDHRHKSRSSRSLHGVWSSPAGAAICELCKRPYWSRLWVFQESKLGKAKTIICGDQAIPWESLTSFLHGIDSRAPGPRVRKMDHYKLTRDGPAYP